MYNASGGNGGEIQSRVLSVSIEKQGPDFQVIVSKGFALNTVITEIRSLLWTLGLGIWSLLTQQSYSLCLRIINFDYV